MRLEREGSRMSTKEKSAALTAEHAVNRAMEFAYERVIRSMTVSPMDPLYVALSTNLERLDERRAEVEAELIALNFERAA